MGYNLPVSEREIIIQKISSQLYRLESLHRSNAYVIGSGNKYLLVDSGVAKDATSIMTELEGAGFSLANLVGLVLTHTHSDHSGGAPKIISETGVPVFAHKDEVPYIEKLMDLPVGSAWRRSLLWLSDHFIMRREPCQVDYKLEHLEQIEGFSGLQTLHTPGHTPGSLSLYHQDEKFLLCGDALFNANPITGKPGLRLPLKVVTLDNDVAYESVVYLASLDVEVLCCGHGEPITESAGEKIVGVL